MHGAAVFLKNDERLSNYTKNGMLDIGDGAYSSMYP